MMSDGEKTIGVSGGNNQILPNADTAIQHIYVGDDAVASTEYDIGIVGGFDGAEGKGIKVVQRFSTHGYLQCLRFAYIVL